MEKFKTPILYGFVIALAGSLLMLSLLALGLLGPAAISSDREMYGGTILFLMIYLFLLIGIYFALKKKKADNKNHLTFISAIKEGTLISFVTGIFSVIFTILFYEFLYPEYVNDLIVALREKMRLTGTPEGKIEEKLAEKMTYFSTSSQSTYSIVGNFITGVAFTFLLGFFLKTAKK